MNIIEELDAICIKRGLGYFRNLTSESCDQEELHSILLEYEAKIYGRTKESIIFPTTEEIKDKAMVRTCDSGRDAYEGWKDGAEWMRELIQKQLKNETK